MKERLQVVSVETVSFGHQTTTCNTQLDFFVANNNKKPKVEDDDSEDNSADDNPHAPSIPRGSVKNLSKSSNVTEETRSLPFEGSKKRDRTLSFNDDPYLKTQTSTEMAEMIIYPDGPLSYYWMSLVTITVMYNIAVIILRLAFSEIRDQRIFFIMDNACDAIYLLDIVVQSRTAFLEDGCLVLDPHAMFQNYRKKYKFWLDIIAIFPVTSAYFVCSFFVNLLTLKFDVLFAVTPLPVLRFLRILKYHQLATFFDIADSRTRKPSLLRAFKLSLHLWVVIHWIACIYYMVSEVEGLGSNEWVYTEDEDGGFRRKYIRSVYWSMMTLTTIGERPSPVTDLEYIFTGTTFLIGVFVFAAVVGNVGDVISNMNAARHDFQARMDQIKFYMNHRNVPEHLQDRVKKWAEYSWNRTQAMDEPSVLAMLPDRLRTEIAIHVHLETLKQVKIFEECEEGLLRELVLKLRPQIYSPGDYICRIGEIGREMYIINHGKIEILVPKGNSTTRVALLTPGNYFGEISLLKLDEGQNRRTADVRAIGYSELLCLSRKDLISALGEYPGAKKILEDQAKERMLQTKGMRQNESELTTGNRPVAEPGKRRAKDIFADVMKQEGFRKLLSTRDREMCELKKLVADMKALSQKRPMDQSLSLLENKCRSLEQSLLTKDAALRQAKRRINQLETYVRIRAYNAKLQVPDSDPEVMKRFQKIPYGSDRVYLRSNSHKEFRHTQTKSLENGSFEKATKDKRFVSLKSNGCQKDWNKEDGFETANKRTIMFMGKDNMYNNDYNKCKLNKLFKTFDNNDTDLRSLDKSQKLCNDKIESKLKESLKTSFDKHISKKVEPNYQKQVSISPFTLKGDGNVSGGQESNSQLNRVVQDETHSGNSSREMYKSFYKPEDSFTSNVVDRNGSDTGNSLDFDKSLTKMLNKSSKNDETIDSGISVKDYLQEDEELLRLVELFGKEGSLDSTASQSNSESSEMSSDDEMEL